MTAGPNLAVRAATAAGTPRAGFFCGVHSMFWQARSRRSGELDIIALDHELLVFVEARTRSSRDDDEPREFVSWQKRQILRRTAEEFIAEHDRGRYCYPFDMVPVLERGPSFFATHFNAGSSGVFLQSPVEFYFPFS